MTQITVSSLVKTKPYRAAVLNPFGHHEKGILAKAMTASILRALPLMLIAMCFIPMGDTAGKLLGGTYGVSPFFTAWSRFAVGALLLAPFALGSGAVRLLSDWRVWLRSAFLVGGICSILTAVQTEPIADVFGAFFVGPILSYFLSALFLREPISTRRTLLLLLGFAGVLLVVKPGFGMTPGLGFAVLAGLCYGSYLTASRWLAGIGRPRALMLSQLIIGAVVLLPVGPFLAPDLSLPVAGLTLASALGSLLGNLLLITALGMAPASRLAPFVYTQLFAATALGWLVFGVLPDTLSIIGLMLIVGSGLATLTLRADR